jgi:hypothetical protein
MRGYILVQADSRADGHDLAREIAQIPGVDRSEHVTGGFDVIAKVGGSVVDRTVLARINAMPGVLRALPLRFTGPLVRVPELASLAEAG